MLQGGNFFMSFAPIGSFFPCLVDPFLEGREKFWQSYFRWNCTHFHKVFGQANRQTQAKSEDPD